MRRGGDPLSILESLKELEGKLARGKVGWMGLIGGEMVHHHGVVNGRAFVGEKVKLKRSCSCFGDDETTGGGMEVPRKGKKQTEASK